MQGEGTVKVGWFRATYIAHLVEGLHGLLVLCLVVFEFLAGGIALVVQVLVVRESGGQLLLERGDLALQRAMGGAGVVARALGFGDGFFQAESLGAELRGADVVSVDLLLQGGDLALGVGELAAFDVDVVLEVVALGVGVAELVDLVVEFWEGVLELM